MEGFWHGEDCGRCGRAEWRLWGGGLGMDFGILIWDRGFIIYVTLDRGKLGLDVLGMDDNFRKY